MEAIIPSRCWLSNRLLWAKLSSIKSTDLPTCRPNGQLNVNRSFWLWAINALQIGAADHNICISNSSSISNIKQHHLQLQKQQLWEAACSQTPRCRWPTWLRLWLQGLPENQKARNKIKWDPRASTAAATTLAADDLSTIELLRSGATTATCNIHKSRSSSSLRQGIPCRWNN